MTWIAYITQISWHLIFHHVFGLLNHYKLTTVNPRWIIAKFQQRGSFHAVWHRYTNMRTSRLIGKGSADSVIDVNIGNSRIYCVFVVLHTTAVETVLACANVWDDGYAQRPCGWQRHKWHVEQSPPSSCCRDHGPSSHPSEHTSEESLAWRFFIKAPDVAGTVLRHATSTHPFVLVHPFKRVLR